jgi:hypothetical protein
MNPWDAALTTAESYPEGLSVPRFQFPVPSLLFPVPDPKRLGPLLVSTLFASEQPGRQR